MAAPRAPPDTPPHDQVSPYADLAVVVGLTLLAVTVVLLPGLRETPLRAVVGFAFTLSAPGYALLAALFPGRDGPGGAARTALSVLASVVVAAAVGGVLSLSVGLSPVTAVLALAVTTLVASVLAVRRRRALTPEDRFAVPLREWAGAVRSELLSPETRGDAALAVLLVVLLVVATGGVAYATVVPGDRERFTEFYLLTEDADGDLVAANYPTEFTVGEPRSQHVGITNREGETVSYTVVVQLQRVTVRNDTVSVRERTEFRRFTPRVADGETWQRNHTVAPTTTGERLRLTYLLYRGSPVPTPTVENAYQSTYTWVNVSAASGNVTGGT